MAEFMFPNVAYRATVYRTGIWTIDFMNEQQKVTRNSFKGKKWPAHFSRLCQIYFLTFPADF